MMRNRLRIIRGQKGLTQTELAQAANVDQSTISAIETDRYTPRVDVAISIARALGVAVEDIFIVDKK